MHAGRRYSAREIVRWTRHETLVFAVLGALPPTAAVLGADVAIVPWAPVAVLGTAVAFVTGFKSNAAYGRLWEARQIWGAIVNASRTWAIQVRDFLSDGEASGAHRRLLLRHVAWLTALRYQLREPRAWESQQLRFNREYRSQTFAIAEHVTPIDQELAPLLSDDDARAVGAKKNRAAALLVVQSAELKRLQDAGQLSELRHIEVVRLLALLIEQQGKCERIKNFPYPRQFATLNLFFVWLFIVLLPFGVATELKRVAPAWLWLTVPLTVLVSWVFHTMDKIGEASENPFEGGPNDIPMTAMTRAIEIELREVLNEPDLPRALTPTHDILL
jgi:ion channel-forming bestrophin family protein